MLFAPRRRTLINDHPSTPYSVYPAAISIAPSTYGSKVEEGGSCPLPEECQSIGLYGVHRSDGETQTMSELGTVVTRLQ